MTKRLDSLICNLVEIAANRAQIPFSILPPYWRKRLYEYSTRECQVLNGRYCSHVMSGIDPLRDLSLNLNTLHIRSVAEYLYPALYVRLFVIVLGCKPHNGHAYAFVYNLA